MTASTRSDPPLPPESRFTQATGDSDAPVPAIRNAFANDDSDTARRHLIPALLAAPTRSALHGLAGLLSIREGRPAEAARAYLRAVALRPGHPEHRFNLALAREAAGETAAALRLHAGLVDDSGVARRSLVRLSRLLVGTANGRRAWALLAPRRDRWWDDRELLPLAGHALLQSGEPERAAVLFRRALRLDPEDAAALVGLATVFVEAERYGEATALLRGHEARLGDDPDAQYVLGVSLFESGRIDAAIPHLQRASTHPIYRAAALQRLAGYYQSAERLADAARAWRAVLRRQPDSYAAVDGLAQVLARQRDADGLRALAASCTGPHQTNPEIWNALAIQLKKCGLTELSHDLYRQAMRLFPTVAAFPFNLAHNLQEADRPREGLRFAERALALRPRYAKAWNTLGIIRIRLRDSVGARAALRHALRIDPRLHHAMLNVGNAYRSEGEINLALEWYRRTLEIAPDYPEAHHNLGFMLIELGELKEGFKAHEHRWQLPHFPSPKRPFRNRIWEGQPLRDDGILVWLEQGIGDEIFFSWQLPLVRRRARRMVVECSDRLVPLMQRSFPTIPFYPRRTPPHSAVVDPGLRWKIPSGHLPGILWPEIKLAMRRLWSMPRCRYRRTEGFLRPDPDRVAYWRRYLDRHAQGRPTVGLSWTSAVLSGTRTPYYMTLEEMIRCLDHPVLAVNLQYNWTDPDLDQLRGAEQCKAMRFLHPEGIHLKNDLDDLAALMQALDLVLTTFTSVGMMAGSVGTPTWVFHASEYGRTWEQFGAPFVPFLPSVDIFWRDPRGPWDGTIDEIDAALGTLCRQWPHPRI